MTAAGSPRSHLEDGDLIAAEGASNALEVFRNRPFLLLWLSQAFTQIGGNMVIYGLTVVILEATSSNTAVSVLILTFLGPAVLFSALAGVYVDRVDRRTILVVTNLLRAGAFVLIFLSGSIVPLILLLNMIVSTITVFFAPAELAMIPFLVPRRQLMAANGVFTLTLNGAFAIGFALLGPIVVTLAGAPALILLVGACYLIAAGFCWTLPSAPPSAAGGDEPARSMAADAERAWGTTLGQLREGIEFIRGHRMISWSLVYLGIAASLVGVLGVLGPDFATDSLGLEPKDFVVVVLPLGFGIVTGILLLNSFGHLLPRRRIIEGGLVALGILLGILAVAGPIARVLQRAETATGLVSLADFTSLLAIVVFVALLAGMSYAFVAIPSQTQLQEDLPEDVRGRVFGVLNMLVSVSSFAPIIIVGPVSDLIGTTTVLLLVAVLICVAGLLSIFTRGPLKPSDLHPSMAAHGQPAGIDPVAVVTASELEAGGWRPGMELNEPHDRGAAPASGHEPAPGARAEAGAEGWRGARVTELGGGDPRPGQRASGLTAGLIVTGRIATLAGEVGPSWVEAIAIDGGRVVAAGDEAQVEVLAGPRTRRLALGPDEAAIPGLTDAHLHLVETALARQQVDLEGAGSITDVQARIRDAAGATGGAWIVGGGWDADLLGRWPSADDLELAAAGRQIALWAHDHHALLVSHAALAAAGIEADRDDPPGGAIRRDADGRATGVLHENAARLVADLVPTATAEAIVEALPALMAELLSLGVVAVHDPGGLSVQPGLGASIAAYRQLAAAGSLGLRVHACVRPEQLPAAIDAGLRSGEAIGPDPLGRLRLGWLKTFADGSLGSRTAALLEPLERMPGQPPEPGGELGVWMTTPHGLRDQVTRAAGAGIATQIHAIGDAAVRAALEVLGPAAGRTTLMPRVEHAQLVADADVPRFAALGVAASMQPVHIRSDAEKARRLWGARADARAFPIAALARSGAVVAFGTDAPVEPIDPWPGLACTVTRSAPSWPTGTPPLGARNAIALWRAIRAACVGPAITAGESDRGRLTPGSRADLVVLAAEIVSEPVEVGGPLWHARPRLVLLDGEVVAGA